MVTTDSLVLVMTAEPSVSKKARRRLFSWVLTWHPKTRFPSTINSFTNFSNKNSISLISGGFTIKLLGSLRIFELFWGFLELFGLFGDFLGFFLVFGLSPTFCQQARLRQKTVGFHLETVG